MSTREQPQRLTRPGIWAVLAGALAGALLTTTGAVVLSGTTEGRLTDRETVLEFTVTGPGKKPEEVRPGPASTQPPVHVSSTAPAAPAPSARESTDGEQRTRVPSESVQQPGATLPDGSEEQSAPATSPTSQPDPTPCPSSTPSGDSEQTCGEEVASDGAEQ